MCANMQAHSAQDQFTLNLAFNHLNHFRMIPLLLFELIIDLSRFQPDNTKCLAIPWQYDVQLST